MYYKITAVVLSTTVILYVISQLHTTIKMLASYSNFILLLLYQLEEMAKRVNNIPMKSTTRRPSEGLPVGT